MRDWSDASRGSHALAMVPNGVAEHVGGRTLAREASQVGLGADQPSVTVRSCYQLIDVGFLARGKKPARPFV